MERIYETMIIFNPDINCEVNINKFTTMCQEFTGEEYEINVEDVGIKTLAYEIKTYKRGHYLQITWKGTQENVMELERVLRIDDTVIKFITIKATDDVDYSEYYAETMLKPRLKPAQIKSEQLVDLLDIIYNL